MFVICGHFILQKSLQVSNHNNKKVKSMMITITFPPVSLGIF